MSLRLAALVLLVALGCGRPPEAPPPSEQVQAVPEGVAPTATPVVCALLDPSKTLQGALLETKLLGDSSLTWVERANVDAVLKEQQLQAAFGPQGVADRVKLGKLLKADLLVLVRPVKDAKEPALEIVVSETAGGLRLLIRGIAITNDSDADVAALQAAVRDGIQKHGEKIREVVAVPPFVSNDFEYTFDHLKGAFAKLAEAEALKRPGVVVVELEEAQALAKELALAGGTLDRPLPVYLLGEYRHEGKDAERTVSLKLRAERGGKPLGTASTSAVQPDASAAYVRSWSSTTLDAILAEGKSRLPADLKAEAKQLADRAMEFKRLGNWEESLALAEASLMLDGRQQAIHLLTIQVSTPLIRAQWSLSLIDRYPFERVAQRYLSGLSHLEAWVEGGGGLLDQLDPGRMLFWVEFLHAPNALGIQGPATPEMQAKVAQLHADVRAFHARMVSRLAPRGKLEELMFMSEEVRFLPQREREERVREYVLSALKGPEARNRIKRYLNLARDTSSSGSPNDDYRRFLKSFETHKDPELLLAVQETRKEFEDMLIRMSISRTPAAPGANPGLVKFTPVVIESKDPETSQLGGACNCGPTLDVFWSGRSLFLMKQKGRLEPVWKRGDLNERISTVCFDGRLVWVATTNYSRGESKLIAIDPSTSKARVIDSKDGLPVSEKGVPSGGQSTIVTTLLATPLEPGRVLAAWSQDRTWIGTVELKADGESVVVQKLLSAVEPQEPADREQWHRLGVVFQPSALLTIGPSNAAADRRVLIGRGDGSRNPDLSLHPLLFDPGRGRIQVHPETFPSWVGQRRFTSDGEAIYAIEHASTREARIIRMKPGSGREVVSVGLPSDYRHIVGHEGRLHITTETLTPAPMRKPEPWLADRRWWTVDPATKQVWYAADQVPDILSLASTAHYGVVAFLRARHDNGASFPTLHAVTLSEPPIAAKLDGRPRPSGKRHPEEDNSVKSAGNGTPTQLVLYNKHGQPIRVHWIDFDGKRKLYGEIEPGKQFEQKTFVGHVWLVTDTDDNAWRLIRPEAKPQTYEITGPDKK